MVSLKMAFKSGWSLLCSFCLGAGLPTLTAAICGSLNVYGKHTIKLNGDDVDHNSTVQL